MDFRRSDPDADRGVPGLGGAVVDDDREVRLVGAVDRRSAARALDLLHGTLTTVANAHFGDDSWLRPS
jgi:hypothetical protein